jgi:cytochrome c-type biogenesis protein CcmH
VRRLLIASCALLALAGLPVAAAEARASLLEIESEVMCPICGTLLELSDSPQARRERAFIVGMIASGRTKAQIKDALVDEYGQEVLALPGGSGFDLSAYLVPAVAFAIAAVALALAALRWRRRTDSDPPPPSSPPRGEDAERLDADISRYDL